MIEQEAIKKCSQCENDRSINLFSRNKNTSDGYQYHCKICVKQYQDENRERILRKQQEYRDNNREQERQRALDYDARNREKRNAYRTQNKDRRMLYAKEYHKQNRERILEKKREYDALNRERFLLRRRQFNVKNRDSVRAQWKRYLKSTKGRIKSRVGKANYRAHKMKAKGKHTAQQLREQLVRQKHNCYYCKAKLKQERNSWHADHVVPLSRGGTNDISNIVITCPTCNFKKNDKLPHEWPDGGRLC